MSKQAIDVEINKNSNGDFNRIKISTSAGEYRISQGKDGGLIINTFEGGIIINPNVSNQIQINIEQ